MRKIEYYEHTLYCELDPIDYESPQILYIRSNAVFPFKYERTCFSTNDLLVITREHEKIYNWIQEIIHDAAIRMFFDVMEIE